MLVVLGAVLLVGFALVDVGQNADELLPFGPTPTPPHSATPSPAASSMPAPTSAAAPMATATPMPARTREQLLPWFAAPPMDAHTHTHTHTAQPVVEA